MIRNKGIDSCMKMIVRDKGRKHVVLYYLLGVFMIMLPTYIAIQSLVQLGIRDRFIPFRVMISNIKGRLPAF